VWAIFLCRQELFRKVVEVNGAVVECGVFNGAGLFTWAQLSNIYEPVNYNRKGHRVRHVRGVPGRLRAGRAGLAGARHPR
jgi:hypothetical protein